MRSEYDQILLDHNLYPSNHNRPISENFHCDLRNASCGDQIEIAFKIENGKIIDGTWRGKGCAISLASADLMIDFLRGKDIKVAQEIFPTISKMLLGEAKDLEFLGDAAALSTVARMPARVKCAHLAWESIPQLPR